MLRSTVFGIFLATAHAASFSDLSALPSCGETCVVNSVNSQTQCATSDYSCLCGDQSLGYNIGYCLGSTCDSADMQASLTWLEFACSQPFVSNTGTSTATATSAGSAASTDSLLTGSTSGSSGGSSEGSSGGSSGSSSSSSSSSSFKKKKGGLSSGAKGGIGAGVAVLAVLLILASVLIWWMKRRKTRKTPEVENPAPAPVQAIPPPVQASDEKVQVQTNVQQYYPPTQQAYVQTPTQPPVQGPTYTQPAPPYDQAPPPPVSPMSTYAQPVPPQSYAVPSPQPTAPELPGTFYMAHASAQPYQQGQQPAMQPPQSLYEAPVQIAPPQGNVYEVPANQVPR
ncbi:hypothetical protein, variant 2 [Verruconis gallopava]|uniref:CFEM domain-containing protein n=2 Tax=Verruconis gallopava TaxID=253628 RepID=A0A0D2AAB7_9PEZI|nr:uncharacterized protein PV09_05025 [Verruconis gallopava]XP_016213583.1 hypothetical protein, variant 1 [Verruconis gallopava]XP_016213584.1 hypothetical protein, variant 2 [Verruconis gallopava]KIW03713.1 hypothetical protein PV09_05025 [Verruconis gallopava]KIW03714.1 hypothetical protein, variant 1 [Verruconis gallopava]KIW03715.1 hypothetical protein, variant 2 [Verruconis gallopava]